MHQRIPLQKKPSKVYLGHSKSTFIEGFDVCISRKRTEFHTFFTSSDLSAIFPDSKISRETCNGKLGQFWFLFCFVNIIRQ